MKNPHHDCRVFGSPWEGVHGTRISSQRRYGRHWHATFGIGIIDEGAQRSASGCGEVEAHVGHLIATNPGEVHDGRPLGGPFRRWRMLYLEPAALRWAVDASATGTANDGDMALIRPVISDDRLRRTLGDLLRLLEARAAAPKQAQADALRCEELLVQTCTMLASRHGAQRLPVHAPSAGVSRAREMLADCLAQPPSLGQLAASSGLSKYQLLRRFREVHGVTPFAWLLQQRAEVARGLIRRGAALADAAMAAGFADQSHMTRAFALHFGFTPGAWQRAWTPPARLQ
ncbi:AraC family transcriptional regulator [Variovorax sp. VRV01]|uniref:AraC family transcriptional regulator n=1 Tax=Variovorax sp. VRV01 TaxID=2769259 RepID=UPI00177FD104|nr:AraC family transcriptional regulator [Variovorax sp. VRV01]MBD9667246.1 AraC family transcriptional regulator [Variovorax sp. VRV01]